MTGPIPIDWLEQLPIATQRDLFRDHFQEPSFTEPIFLDFQLPWEVEDWISGTVAKYGHPEEEIIEILVQLGEYISKAYPEASAGIYFHAFCPIDRLLSRAQIARTKVGLQESASATLIERIEAGFSRHQVRRFEGLSDRQTSAKSDAFSASQESAKLAPDLRKIDSLETALGNGKPESRRQPLAGPLVYYLFEEGIRRNKSPANLLWELGYTARFLDYNFVDSRVPSLREQLLLKVMAAERIGHEINAALSALETMLVDCQKVLELQRQIIRRTEDFQ